jgi:hypothetical protein
VGDIVNVVWQLKNVLQQQHWNYSFMMQVFHTKLHDCVQLFQKKEHLWLLTSSTITMKLCVCWNFEVLLIELFQKFIEV